MDAVLLGRGGRKYTDVCNLLSNGSPQKMDWCEDTEMDEYVI